MDYLGSVQCFCHIELGGRAWKCPLCNLGRTSRRTSQCLCDASRWDTLARRPSKSPRLPLDLQFRNEFYKVLKVVKVHLALFVVEWMRIKHCVGWCLASIIRIVWRTTVDSCFVCLWCSTYPLSDQRSRDKQFPGDEEELAFSDSKGHAPKRPLRFASHLLVGDLLRGAPATSIINCWLHQVHILNLFDIEMKGKLTEKGV